MTAVNGDTARKRIPDAVSTQQGRLFSVIHISTHVEVERVVACVTKKKTNTYLYAMYNIFETVTVIAYGTELSISFRI